MLSRLMTIKEQALIAAFAAALVLGAGTAIYLRSQPAPGVAIQTPAVAAVPLSPAAGSDSSSKQPVPAKRLVVPEVVAVAPQQVAQADEVETPVVVVSEPAIAAPQEKAVAAAGAVLRPGLYRLNSDARVQDLIDAAGGIAERADTSGLNLSAKLIDGTTLTVPASAEVEIEGRTIRARGAARVYNPPQYTVSGIGIEPTDEPPAAMASPQPQPSAAPAAAPVDGKIDLNLATQQELESLPGIGPALAQRIIAQRPFARVEDLTLVTGIAEKRFAALENLVTVAP